MFIDRVDAGRRLARRLEGYRDAAGAVVLGVPRGGIPVAAEVARELGLPLDPLFVKKIGHPEAPEVAIGAAGLRTSRVDEEWAARCGARRGYVEAETARVQSGLLGRCAAYPGASRPLAGAVAILVDDGAATGLTLELGVRILRAEGAARVVVAVPVAAPSAGELLSKTADEFVCLAVPEGFLAIGEYYRDFSQVPDEEAIGLLLRSAARGPRAVALRPEMTGS